jgi:hypothetical protein
VRARSTGAVRAYDPARRSALSHGCHRSMRQTSDGRECGLRKPPFLMSRDRVAIRSASSLQGICQYPHKARFRETHFHRSADGRQRLLHRLGRLRMTAARRASCLRAAARWSVLCREFHPVHVQGHAVLQGSLPKCRGTNRSRCRRGPEERSKSCSEGSDQKHAYKFVWFGFRSNAACGDRAARRLLRLLSVPSRSAAPGRSGGRSSASRRSGGRRCWSP